MCLIEGKGITQTFVQLETFCRLNKFSSYSRLLRVVAWILHWKYKPRSLDPSDPLSDKIKARNTSPSSLTSVDLARAQRESFSQEIEILRKGLIPK